MTTSAAALSDFYVPAHEVRVNGASLPGAASDILSVTYSDALDSVDSFTLELNNWDPDKRELKHSEGGRFKPGGRVQLKLGYLGDTELMCDGKITTLQPRFPASGPPTLTVTGTSILHTLQTEARDFTWENKTDREIASQIAQAAGLQIEITGNGADSRQRYLLQDGKTDIEFLLTRAAAIGYELTAQVGGAGKASLRFAPRGEAPLLPFALKWGSSLLSFDPRISTTRQVGAVVVQAAHPTDGCGIVATVRRSELGPSPYLAAYDDRREVISDRAVNSAADAHEVALARMREIARKETTASASTVGLPGVRAGVRVRVLGLMSEYLNGTWFVTGSTHTLNDNGYTTSFEAQREVGR